MKQKFNLLVMDSPERISNYTEDLKEAYKKSLRNTTIKGRKYSKFLLSNLKQAIADELNFPELPIKTDLDKFAERLKKCKENPSCISGKYNTETGIKLQVFKDKELKKALIHPVSCKCPYCDNLRCMDLRKKEAHMILKPFFEHAKKNKQHCSHAVFGFPRLKLEEITPCIITEMRIKMQKVRTELIGKNHLLRVVGVMDISYNKEDETYYFHWHMAIFFPNWHRGNLKYKEIRDITSKYGMTFTRFENGSSEGKLFRNPVRVLDYISKRYAGILEHPSGEKEEYSKYADFFTQEQYYNLFYRQKRVFVWGYSAKERKFIKGAYKRDFLCSIIGNNHRFYCEGIGEIEREQIIFIVDDLKNYQKPDIPQEKPENMDIEYYKYVAGNLIKQ